jgi:hypothetical protein
MQKVYVSLAFDDLHVDTSCQGIGEFIEPTRLAPREPAGPGGGLVLRFFYSQLSI